MKIVKLCRECKHSTPDPDASWALRCMHPNVNAKDSYALGGSKPYGSNARNEREKGIFAPCGMRGALWEEK